MRGTRLKPSTVETIREQLEMQRLFKPTWIEFHFSKIAQRGTPVDYEDVTGMTDREADSVRHLLGSGISFGRKKVGRLMAKSLTLLSESDAGQNNEWSVRVHQLEEALRDVCVAYDLLSPL